MFALRLESSDAGNDPSGTNTRQAFDLLGQGFGGGFNGPLLIVTELPGQNKAAAQAAVSAAVAKTPNVVAVTPPRISPSGNIAVFEAYPGSAPQAVATTDLVNHLRDDVAPPIEHQTGATVLVGGFTAGSIDFSHVLANKLPLFIGIVVVLSALLLFVIFRSIVIPIQAALMNLLSIGGALGVTVLVFQHGWFASVIGVEKGPVEPWIPVLMFAVVFGLSMDYEVFLISRVREQWIRRHDASEAVADGIAFTGRVITAAAAIMICVFLSFMLGNERVLKEFGFGLAVAVLLDALVVRCVLLPAVLELLGPRTWWLPRWLDARLPHINIEGSSARGQLRPAGRVRRGRGARAGAGLVSRVEFGGTETPPGPSMPSSNRPGEADLHRLQTIRTRPCIGACPTCTVCHGPRSICQVLQVETGLRSRPQRVRAPVDLAGAGIRATDRPPPPPARPSTAPRGYARNVPISSGSSPASAIHAERSPWPAAVRERRHATLELGDHERPGAPGGSRTPPARTPGRRPARRARP